MQYIMQFMLHCAIIMNIVCNALNCAVYAIYCAIIIYILCNI
jgi:hypothetical protein